MKMLSFYDEAHIFTAAVRVFEFKYSTSPMHSDISELTGMDIDRVGHIASKLVDLEIIEMVDGPFGKACFLIADHLAIENLEREIKKNHIAEELESFQKKAQSSLEKKVLQFTEEKKKKDKALFDDLANKLKAEIKKE